MDKDGAKITKNHKLAKATVINRVIYYPVDHSSFCYSQRYHLIEIMFSKPNIQRKKGYQEREGREERGEKDG